MKTIILQQRRHRNQFWLEIQFPYDKDLVAIVKKIPGIRYSNTHHSWLLPFSRESISLAESVLSPIVHLDKDLLEQAIHLESNIHLGDKLDRYILYMRSKRYSESTIVTYSNAVRVFFAFFWDKTPEGITNEDVINFNNQYIMANGLSNSYQNQFINGLKLFYSMIEKRSLDIELIHRPRRERVLPNVLSKAEVKQVLESLINLKHRTMLSLIYSCGLRCGELIRLRPEHIQSNRNLLLVKKAKGNKDRIIPLSEKTIGILREYYKIYKPKTYLFEGQKEGGMYDPRSLQMILKKAVFRAGIKKPVTLHWLRHSYATHLLESGTDLRYIQEILGHNSSRTTEIYTHVSTRNIQQIQSPFDTL